MGVRRSRIVASPLGEKLRVFARAYGASGQKERAEGLLQAADTVDAELAGTTTGLVDDPLVITLLEVVRTLTRAAEQVTEAAADMTAIAVDSTTGKSVQRFQSHMEVDPAIRGAIAVGRKTQTARQVNGEHRILTAVAQHQDGCTRQQLTVLTGYKASTRNTYIQRLRVRGLVTDTDRLRVTDAGRVELGPSLEPLPTGSSLVSYWLAKLPDGERRILDALLAQPLTRDEITDRTGYKPSTRNTYIQRLRSRELVYFEGDLLYPDVQLTHGG